ncbi:MAG: hypothetical protein ABIH85_02650 [Candidatus Omnitrophota bacterium]
MKTWLLICFILVFGIFVFTSGAAFSAGKSSSDLLKEGLLGAGAGAIGGAASGAKGGNVWKGALAGAGVSIIGGALLDSLSGEKVNDVNSVDSISPRTAYSDGYEAGYGNGYKKGYSDGYKEAMQERNTKF